MAKRYISIWFRHLHTDWFTLRQPNLKNLPFALRTPSRGRMIVTAANARAESNGICSGMALADAQAIVPDLKVEDSIPNLSEQLLKRLAEWCIRFTPIVAVDSPDGLILDATGCSHLWGGDLKYVADIQKKLESRGYEVSLAMADTIGAAWGAARFGKDKIISSDKLIDSLMSLPPEALRLEPEIVERLHKLGLHQIKRFIKMPKPSLRRRFGDVLIIQLDRALGHAMETIQPVIPIEPYQERLPCLEPIVTSTGIEIALRQLLDALCIRLKEEQKGLRTSTLKCYRVDGKTELIKIGTSRPSHSVNHLFKLFENKISSIEPALGIELFVLEASKVEDHFSKQEKMWDGVSGLEDVRLAELLDRLANKIEGLTINRYLPDEHYWPERSYKSTLSLEEKPTTTWRADKLRPLQLLQTPESIGVMAPIPDYPPMLFSYRGKIHQITKADGPERIEQEWWLQQGEHRDYYRVEDEEGHRYWLFRLGHYDDKNDQWFLHGFFA